MGRLKAATTNVRIAIDARELTGKPTGVGRYLAELLSAWSDLPAASAHEFILCATERVVLPRPSALRLTALVEPGHGTAWEQTMLPRLIREARGDVLFAPGYTAPLLTSMPTVLAIHDVSFAAHPEWFSRREGLRRRVLTRLSARRATHVLTVSDFSKREIVRHLGVDQSKVEVIYHGATILSDVAAAFSRRHSVGATRRPMVLFVGSLFERRHIPELVDGFSRIAHRHPEARLEIVGDNRSRPPVDVEGLARARGTAGRVSAREYVSEPELSELYTHATAFAFLSDYEGFGMTPLEALASGVPIVVLDTEVSREIYGPAAIYIPRPDPVLIEAALEAALFDAGERARILEAAPQVLARYSWQECAHRTLQALLAAGAGPAKAGHY
jgi:glycosyltransferase involved in cell wall biosynthesis